MSIAKVNKEADAGKIQVKVNHHEDSEAIEEVE
jgi:hypothetical protein